MSVMSREVFAVFQTFAVGERVCLARVNRPDCRNKTGTVAKCIKRRGVIRVTLDDDGTSYDAFPCNLDKIS